METRVYRVSIMGINTGFYIGSILGMGQWICTSIIGMQALLVTLQYWT